MGIPIIYKQVQAHKLGAVLGEIGLGREEVAAKLAPGKEARAVFPKPLLNERGRKVFAEIAIHGPISKYGIFKAFKKEIPISTIQRDVDELAKAELIRHVRTTGIRGQKLWDLTGLGVFVVHDHLRLPDPRPLIKRAAEGREKVPFIEWLIKQDPEYCRDWIDFSAAHKGAWISDEIGSASRAAYILLEEAKKEDQKHLTRLCAMLTKWRAFERYVQEYEKEIARLKSEVASLRAWAKIGKGALQKLEAKMKNQERRKACQTKSSGG